MKPSLLLVPALAASLSAQTTYTFPSDHASIPDGSSSTYFFPYSYGVSRMQALYDAWDITVPINSPISRIGFRQDGNTASTGHALQLEVLMGYSNLTSATMSGTYATNVIGSMTTVFGPGLFTLPTLSSSSSGTIIWLNLTTPFTYNPPAGQNLLIEWRITANNNGNAQWSYYLDRGQFVSTVTSGQAGCPHSGNNTALLTSQPAAVDGYWSMNLSRAPASSLFFLLQTPARQLVPAYPLTPFIPGIQASCTGQLDLAHLFVTTGTTNTGGSFSWQTRIPNIRTLNDVYCASQVAIVDFFSPGGFVVSNGDQVQLGIDPAQTILYSQGSTTATTGSLQRNYGVITLFQ